MSTQLEPTPQEKVAAIMAELGLSFTFDFVPLSKVSAERRKNWSHDGRAAQFLTWKATLSRAGRSAPVIETEYSAGSGHCPASKLSVVMAGGQNSLMRAGAIAYECEHGRPAIPINNASAPSGFSVQLVRPSAPRILPDPCDVLHSLVSDSDAIDHPTFESWAGDYGYDIDSRSAQATYRACLAIGLALRSALGEDGLRRLRDAGQDY